MSDIESEIRKLVSSYGYQYVNDTLQSMMKNEYIYLSKLFLLAVTRSFKTSNCPLPIPANTFDIL